jgi:hypothetical protein
VEAESPKIWWQRENPLSCQIFEHSYQPTLLTSLSVLPFVSMISITIVWTDKANEQVETKQNFTSLCVSWQRYTSMIQCYIFKLTVNNFTIIVAPIPLMLWCSVSCL